MANVWTSGVAAQAAFIMAGIGPQIGMSTVRGSVSVVWTSSAGRTLPTGHAGCRPVELGYASAKVLRPAVPRNARKCASAVIGGQHRSSPKQWTRHRDIHLQQCEHIPQSTESGNGRKKCRSTFTTASD
ncbi:hypothetical protein BV20DRAFT_963464 [Pilatotrama ljubarskyi]|nr:hypothetical protein BV20DRAFT_963464 [Pilatotrama ljubarskyi]